MSSTIETLLERSAALNAMAEKYDMLSAQHSRLKEDYDSISRTIGAARHEKQIAELKASSLALQLATAEDCNKRLSHAVDILAAAIHKDNNPLVLSMDTINKSWRGAATETDVKAAGFTQIGNTYLPAPGDGACGHQWWNEDHTMFFLCEQGAGHDRDVAHKQTHPTEPSRSMQWFTHPAPWKPGDQTAMEYQPQRRTPAPEP